MQIISAILGGTVATLAANSGLNMYQTFSLADQHKTCPHPNSNKAYGPILSQYISSADGQVRAPADKSVDEIVSDLKKLKRSELIELWLGCEAPSSIIDVDGDWNGVLLDNNGPVMTFVSTFLTDGLFGRRYGKWNGKAFDARMNGGINRFFPRGNDDDIQREHRFDCKVDLSRIDPNSKALCLQYSEHQSQLSLWHSMRDEIRVLQLSGKKGRKRGGILLGLGCMKWSGAYWREGMMNSSPFCLWR